LVKPQLQVETKCSPPNIADFYSIDNFNNCIGWFCYLMISKGGLHSRQPPISEVIQIEKFYS